MLPALGQREDSCQRSSSSLSEPDFRDQTTVSRSSSDDDLIFVRNGSAKLARMSCESSLVVSAVTPSPRFEWSTTVPNQMGP